MGISNPAVYLVLFLSLTYVNAGLFQNLMSKFSKKEIVQDPDTPEPPGLFQNLMSKFSKKEYVQDTDNTGIGVPSGGGSGSEVTYYAENGTIINPDNDSVASSRGHYQSHYPQHHHQNDQNMDLYQLLGGLSFASLLGATIIFLARRNTTAGRRRRSLDDDEMTEITDGIDDPWWEKDKVEPLKLVY